MPQTRLDTPHPHPTVGIAQIRSPSSKEKTERSWARVNVSNLRILWMDAGAFCLPELSSSTHIAHNNNFFSDEKN